jgi:YD repeat-containing protein
VIPRSDRDVPSDDAAHRAQDSVRSGSKRRPLGTATTASHEEDRDWEVGCHSVGRISATTRSGRRSTRMPTDYLKRLLEEACPNHAYPIRHKLKDSGIM